MNILSMLGAGEATKTIYWNWTDYVTNMGGENAGWVSTLLGVMSTVLWIVLALAGAAGAIYAVYVGIKMARADSAEAREENKKRLINIIVTIVVVIVLIVFFNSFLPAILSAFKGNITPEVTP